MEKIKNLSALRIVVFAVAIAIILGLSSVMLSFTASAENVSSDRVTLEDGTQVPTINGFSIIGSKAVTNIMVSYIRKTYGDGLIFLIAQDKTTKDIYYSRFPQAYLHDKEYLYCYFPGGYDCTAPFATSDSSVYDYFYIDDTYTAHHEGYGKSFKPSFYNGSSEAVSPNLSNLNYYWCYTKSIKFDKTNACSLSAIVGKSDNSGFKEGVTPGLSPSAKFVTCASFTNDDGSFPLWCKSFVAEGQQYPLFTYFIKDNGNKHKYSLVLSYNNNDVAGALCTAFYDKLTNDMWRSSLKVPSLKYVSTNIYPMHDAGDMIRKAALRYFESGWKNATFSQSFNLNGSDMDFSNSTDSGNKVYTLCLSDYSAIVAGQIYKVEIWDNTISEILDTTYFVSRDSFGKSNSGTGVKIYDYKDDGDRMEQDIINNTPSVTPGTGSDFKTTGDIEWSQFNDDLTNVDITSIFSSLHFAINSVGVFFQACWAIIPSSIFAILVSGLSLIIVLRILGR
mgnify:CR=1 FL=1